MKNLKEKRWKMCFEEMVGADTCVILVLLSYEKSVIYWK